MESARNIAAAQTKKLREYVKPREYLSGEASLRVRNISERRYIYGDERRAEMERRTQPGYEYHSCDFMDDGVYIDMNLLREYEDTGLTPQEIMELKERDTAKKMLPLTYKPLLEAGWRYECPNCGCAVGENIYHPDVTKDYEYCSMCGQKLEG